MVNLYTPSCSNQWSALFNSALLLNILKIIIYVHVYTMWGQTRFTVVHTEDNIIINK